MADAEAKTDVDEPAGRDPLRVVTIVLVAVMVLGFIGSTTFQIVTAQSERVVDECYKRAFDDLNGSLRVSREIARQDRTELQQMVSALLEPEATPQQRRQALEEYVAASRAAEQARAGAPLPAITCR